MELNQKSIHPPGCTHFIIQNISNPCFSGLFITSLSIYKEDETGEYENYYTLYLNKKIAELFTTIGSHLRNTPKCKNNTITIITEQFSFWALLVLQVAFTNTHLKTAHCNLISKLLLLFIDRVVPW